MYDIRTTSHSRADAALGYVRTTKQRGDDSAIIAMADDVEQMSDAGSIALRESRYLKAKALQKRGDRQGALSLYKPLSDDVRFSAGAEASYIIILDEYESGNHDVAEKLVFAFAEKNPSSAYWLGLSFITLGDIYNAKGDLFQARATYQSVVDGYSPPDDGVIATAKERISRLK